MANPEHVEIVKRGAKAIADWRRSNPEIRPHLDLSEADLDEAYLDGAGLVDANLSRAHLNGARLTGADLQGADLQQAELLKSDLIGADLAGADLSGAKLIGADLMGADLRETKLLGADLTEAVMFVTVLSDVDPSEVKGLDSIGHRGPSTIGVDTLFKSQGKIPASFLRGCGVPEVLIEHLPILIGAMQPSQYYSCFISHSSRDDEFARRLHGRLEQEKLRVWFSPEDMHGGKKSAGQIEEAIQAHDRLLLVLSPDSIESEWVRREIKRARQKERQSGKHVLFPIRVMSFDELRAWEFLDSDTGEDLAEKVREYHIPDFSHWKDQVAFERGFADLMRDLRRNA